MEVEINQACANGIEAKSANQGKQYGQKSAQKRPPPPPPGVRQNYELTPIVPVNDRLFEYYRQQGIVPEEEWSNFEEALKTELPASFRVQLSLGESQNLANHIESKFIPEITNIAREEGPSSGIDPPEKISFVPFAYQTKMSRQAIRSHTILKDFHEFLINETQLGCISRQEVCSMIPPLLLRIESHHVILDACAAPGSKTMQMLELMHKDTANPEGMLVANDVDYKRCYLLVHQTLKRIPTANCVVTSHDSTHLPAIIGSDQKPLLFDRILCDLICSGDGTFRKNPDLWRTWDPMKGVHLHKLQLHIARRCIELLKPDGLMCYSTCSMNPLEDEAVIAQILRLSKGTVELVDISGELLGLKRTPGISKWKVFNKELKAYVSAEEIPQAERRHLKPSMFPPSDEEAQQMHLERCFRILPHQQNTGGFFVALLRKTQPTPLEEVGKIMHPPIGKPAPAKRRRFQNKEDPFVFLADRGEEKEVQEELKTHFGVPADEFPYRNLLVRSNNAERKKEIYYVNDMLRQFLVHNRDRFKIVNAGLGILKKIVSDKVAPCPYRLKQDGLPLLIPWINKRNLHISPQLLITILKGGAKSAVIPRGDGKPTQYVSKLELGEHSQLFEDLEPGSVVLQVSEPFSKAICAWIGANSVSAFVSREERFHLLSILGQDITDFKRNTNTTRQVKAQRVKDNQVDEQDEEMQMKNADE